MGYAITLVKFAKKFNVKHNKLCYKKVSHACHELAEDGVLFKGV